MRGKVLFDFSCLLPCALSLEPFPGDRSNPGPLGLGSLIIAPYFRKPHCHLFCQEKYNLINTCNININVYMLSGQIGCRKEKTRSNERVIRRAGIVDLN